MTTRRFLVLLPRYTAALLTLTATVTPTAYAVIVQHDLTALYDSTTGQLTGTQELTNLLDLLTKARRTRPSTWTGADV